MLNIQSDSITHEKMYLVHNTRDTFDGFNPLSSGLPSLSTGGTRLEFSTPPTGWDCTCTVAGRYLVRLLLPLAAQIRSRLDLHTAAHPGRTTLETVADG